MEKIEFEYRHKLEIIEHFGSFGLPRFRCKIKSIFFESDSAPKSGDFSIETLMENLKPVVNGKILSNLKEIH